MNTGRDLASRGFFGIKIPNPPLGFWFFISKNRYSRGLPLLVVDEKGIRPEGLLELGNDWYAQSIPLDNACLNSNESNGILASWTGKIE